MALTQDRIGLTEETAHGLHDEGTVGMRCRTEHADAPAVQLDDERRVVRHKSSRGPDVCREQVRRHERQPMRVEEREPRHRALSAGRNACRLQDARNRRPAHVMAHVLQGALNPRVAPRRIARPALGATEERCRASRGSRLGTAAGAQAMAEFREAPTFVVFETQPPPLKTDLHHTILFAEKRDHVLDFTLSATAQHR